MHTFVFMKKDTSKLYIQHFEVESDNVWSNYLIITEFIDKEPLLTYYYQVPPEYQIPFLLGKEVERYYQFCPN